MAKGVPPQPLMHMELKFYYGVAAIAEFLGVTERSAKRWLQKGKLPAKKDIAGRWVMTNIDYYLSLQG